MLQSAKADFVSLLPRLQSPGVGMKKHGRALARFDAAFGSGLQ